MTDAVLIKIAEQMPALVLFAMFFGYILRMGVKAVETRDRAFLKALGDNTNAVRRMGKVLENVSRNRRKATR